MDTGDLITRLTIWLSLSAYAAGEAGRAGLLATFGPAWPRVMWTFGCLLYAAHVVAAFSFEHAWSHAAAYENTARQTETIFGLDWGGGLYVNYAFSALWVSEVAWWWLAPARYLNRRHWMDVTVRSVFLFMIASGAVVFVHGSMRWVGLAIVGALAATWWAGPRSGDARGA